MAKPDDIELTRPTEMVRVPADAATLAGAIEGVDGFVVVTLKTITSPGGREDKVATLPYDMTLGQARRALKVALATIDEMIGKEEDG